MNQCMAASGGGSHVPMIMWMCNANGGQMWTTIDNGGGSDPTSFAIVDQSYDDCLSVPGDSFSNGAQLTESCDNEKSKMWDKVDEGGGYYEVVNDYAGLCLSVAGGSITNGAKVIQWTCQGTSDQPWHSNSGW